MKKIDLTRIPYLDIRDQQGYFDIAHIIGNTMFMNGENIVENELGRKVYHSADPLGDYNPVVGWLPKDGEQRPDCSIEISEKEEEILNRFVAKSYSYIVQKALKDALQEA